MTRCGGDKRRRGKQKESDGNPGRHILRKTNLIRTGKEKPGAATVRRGGGAGGVFQTNGLL